MPIVSIDPTQSYIGFSQYQQFAFQIGFSTDSPVTAWNATGMPAGLGIDTATGLISGSVATPGTYVIGLRPANASGTAGITYFTIGIDTADGSSTVAGSPDIGLNLYLDVESREVRRTLTTAPPTPEEAAQGLYVWVSGDVSVINLRIVKNGVILDPDPTSLKFWLKDDETDAPLEIAGGARNVAFAKLGSGTSASYKIPVALTSAKLRAGLSDYEKSEGTFFLAKAQIEMRQDVALPGCSELVTTSRTYLVLLQREFA